MVFLRFFLDARMDSFLRGHALAFAAFGGVPRVLLYDNLKSAVLERVGDAIRFNPALLALAGHYRFEPRPVAPARGNEKGRVERAIRYVREGFFAGRSFTDLEDLNAQAQAWVAGTSADRRWVEDISCTVRQAFEAEREKLLALPEREFALGERVAVTVGKTPYIRFDLNDYSVPHTHVRRTLAVLADEHTVRVLDGAALLARHDRCWDRGQQIEEPAHVQRLAEHKRAARAHRGLDRLAAAAPAAATLLERAAARGHNLGSITAALLRLLERWGAAALQAAVVDALQRDVPHPNAVRLALERAREASGQPPPEALNEFERGHWGTKYATVVAAWRRAWDRVIPFFAFPPAVRRVVYTTNAIERVHSRLRKIIKTRGHFPSVDAATKLIWLALRNITADWGRAAKEWREAMNQFAIFYEERFTAAAHGAGR